MNFDKKTKKVGGWNFFFEAKPTMGEKGKHESFHDFYAPVEDCSEEQQCVLAERKEKKKRIIKIAAMAALVVAVAAFVIWQLIDNPQYFSFIPTK